MKNSAENISLSAYARHRRDKGLTGKSHESVRRAIESGRIRQSVVMLKNGRRAIRSAVLADQEWASSTNPRIDYMPHQNLSEYERSRASGHEVWTGTRDQLINQIIDENTMATELMAILLARGVTDVELAAHFKPLEGTEVPDNSTELLLFLVQAGTEALEEH